MHVDAIAALGGDPIDHAGQADVIDVGGPAAPATDHMMVMIRWLARDVGVVTRWKVDPFDRADAFERVEGPENGRAADSRLAPSRVINKIGGGEMALAPGDEVGNGAARPRQSISGPVEGGEW